MANKKYEIRYLSTFITQFNEILYYITYELKNKIAADKLYNEVVKEIETRSIAPQSYEVFKVIKNEKIKYYTILAIVNTNLIIKKYDIKCGGI